MKAIVAMDLTEAPEIGNNTKIYTVLNKKNKKWANNHKGVGVHFIKTPSYIAFGDKAMSTFVHKAMKIDTEFNNMLQFVYFAHMTAFYISNAEYDEVIFENQMLCEKVLLQFGNDETYGDKTEIF
ncbi:hypothetical protein [Companilactobacillus zhongbaensis]|uniref:hypothetical protein n=1 Tax=Companilactobacillus zhongbaensis TaxID=2486009 RepID=UPI000F7B41AF|nr:hypothetical protein [Companilactobacillus zhongbaensis]